MSRAKNTIKFSDISTTPVKLYYSSSIKKSEFSSYGINIISGSNGLVMTNGSVNQDTINYRLIRQLYYQNYLTGSLMRSASYWNWNEQSTAYSGSIDYENRYFPSESNSIIQYLAIPSLTFGEQITPSSFRLRGNTKVFADDGNGNLMYTNTNPYTHAGNVIYSQGIVTITNQGLAQEDIFSDTRVTMSFFAETTMYHNEYRCRVSENDFNYTQNPSATISASTGSYIDAVTGSDFRPYTTCVGLYNGRDELLVVGKLSTPYPIPPNTDMTFVVRWDS